MLLAQASTDSALPVWLTAIVLPLAVSLVGGGLIAAWLNRQDTARSRRRQGYASAVAAVVAWIEYPFRVRRRTSDDPDTLAELAGLGHDVQERLAASLAWVAADDAKRYEDYSALVALAHRTMGPLVQEAWRCSPVAGADGMNLNGWGAVPSGEVQRAVEAFLKELKPLRRGP